MKRLFDHLEAHAPKDAAAWRIDSAIADERFGDLAQRRDAEAARSWEGYAAALGLSADVLLSCEGSLSRSGRDGLVPLVVKLHLAAWQSLSA